MDKFNYISDSSDKINEYKKMLNEAKIEIKELSRTTLILTIVFLLLSYVLIFRISVENLYNETRLIVMFFYFLQNSIWGLSYIYTLLPNIIKLNIRKEYIIEVNDNDIIKNEKVFRAKELEWEIIKKNRHIRMIKLFISMSVIISLLAFLLTVTIKLGV